MEIKSQDTVVEFEGETYKREETCPKRFPILIWSHWCIIRKDWFPVESSKYLEKAYKTFVTKEMTEDEFYGIED